MCRVVTCLSFQHLFVYYHTLHQYYNTHTIEPKRNRTSYTQLTLTAQSDGNYTNNSVLIECQCVIFQKCSETAQKTGYVCVTITYCHKRNKTQK